MARSGRTPDGTRSDPFASAAFDATSPAYAPPMRFEVLGHLRALAVGSKGERGTEAVLGGPKQRLVLALLLARPNEVVSTDRLIDDVWGDDVPGTARHTVQGYVSELRKVVGPALERIGSGYRMQVDAAALDALEFESLVSDGVSRAGNDPAGAAGQLRRALDLCHGPPYGGFEHHTALAAEVARLGELRLDATEHLMRAELALGRHGTIAGELERLTVEHPYREELRALHMLALYRSGRQAEALRAYQRTARVLAEELGIDPSPSLARLEERILVQDQSLDLDIEGTATELAATAPIENPYKGLQPFREGDRDAFFGRTALIDQIVATLAGDARMVTVVGPSGSGKSSVIHAGVVPRHRDQPGRVLIATMQPGAHPFADLERALVGATADPPATIITQLRDGDDGVLRAALTILGDDTSRLLLVIDQFEELFTLAADAERERFLKGLATVASDTRRRVQVLVALRADFYDRPLRYRDFAPLVTEQVVHVLPLSGDELEAAATLPAQRVGLAVEPRLLAALIADVRDQPHALPLFQYALTELYERRQGQTLTHSGYQTFGGLRRVVANRADELYASLDGEQKGAARQLFLRLVAVAGNAEGRRRILASELTELEVDVVALQAVIEAFGGHRLLTLDRDPATGAPTVEVAHEALLQEWTLLRGWLDAARTDLRLHRGFAVAVDEWIQAGRDPDYLLSGGRLAEYERWAASTVLRLTGTERHFLDDAVTQRRAAETAERDRLAAESKLRRGARRRTWALVGTLAALAGVLGVMLFAPGESARPTIGAFGFDRGNNIDELVIGGLERAARDRDFEPVVIGTTLSDPGASLASLAAGAGLIIVGLPGRDLLTADIVAAHPDTTWAVFDPPAGPIPGVASFTFAVHEGSFLVGAAAALESRTGVVGFVGGQQIPQIEAFRAGFEAGARAAKPDVEVLAAFVAAGPYLGFGSPDRARLVATSLYERGADVVFHAAGESGYGVFGAAADQSDVLGRHLWAIGVDSDQYFELPEALREHVLTSMVKRFDLGVYETTRAYLDGRLEPGNTVFTLADGAVGFSTSGDHLAAATIARLEAFEAEIASGARTVPLAPVGPVDSPLGAAAPTPVTVSWDGHTCAYDGPTSWRVNDVIRFDVTNISAADAQVWAHAAQLAQPLVGVDLAPGGQMSATLELRNDETFAVMCYPLVDGRPIIERGVAGAQIAVRGAAAGTYTTSALGPRLTYTVPEGWKVDEFAGSVALSPPRWDDWPPLMVLSEVRAADQTCVPRPEPGVGPTATDIAAWLAEHPGLVTSVPAPVEIGGLTGQVIDLSLVDGWTSTCEVSGPEPAIATLFRPGTDTEEHQWWVESPGWTTRYILLDVPGAGTVVIDIELRGEQAAWSRMFAEVAPVLDSFVFELRPTD